MVRSRPVVLEIKVRTIVPTAARKPGWALMIAVILALAGHVSISSAASIHRAPPQDQLPGQALEIPEVRSPQAAVTDHKTDAMGSGATAALRSSGARIERVEADARGEMTGETDKRSEIAAVVPPPVMRTLEDYQRRFKGHDASGVRLRHGLRPILPWPYGVRLRNRRPRRVGNWWQP